MSFRAAQLAVQLATELTAKIEAFTKARDEIKGLQLGVTYYDQITKKWEYAADNPNLATTMLEGESIIKTAYIALYDAKIAQAEKDLMDTGMFDNVKGGLTLSRIDMSPKPAVTEQPSNASEAA